MPAEGARVILVMGVCGSGKSTFGRRLCALLGGRFLEGDDFHPAANVAKMAAGLPLDDADRAPWLDALNEALRAGQARGEALQVVACSALKARYRARLREGLEGWSTVFLEGAPETLEARLRGRRGHFMPGTLLASQLAVLERPDDALVVSIEEPVEAAVGAAAAALAPR